MSYCEFCGLVVGFEDDSEECDAELGEHVCCRRGA